MRVTSGAVLWLVAAIAGAQDGRGTYPRLETFARALAHIESSHVERADPDALIDGAIRGMLKVLDPHSAYLDPGQLRVLESDTEGHFGGIGIEIDVHDGWLTVLRALPGAPAARAGVKPGDRFLTIDGQPARDLPIDEAIERMRGEPGTRVRVALRRDGAPDAIEVTLTREVIEVEAVTGRVFEDRVVYVRLRVFQSDTADVLRRVLDEAVDATSGAGGVRGVLLDLRDNPGGLLRAAVDVADEFLRDGVIVSTRGRGGRRLRDNEARAAGTRPDWPMVVLVNGYSASAAEIVAGALQDRRRALVVGTRTFGKGSVQNVIELPDGSALKLTTALYFTPSGRSIQAQGIEPDVVIEQLDPEVLRRARGEAPGITEASLERHLRASHAGASPVRGARELADDHQAASAYGVLRAVIAQSGR